MLIFDLIINKFNELFEPIFIVFEIIALSVKHFVLV